MLDAAGFVEHVLANGRRTTPELGNVEAYARRHRRIVPSWGRRSSFHCSRLGGQV
jgi:hypothetical protein